MPSRLLARLALTAVVGAFVIGAARRPGGFTPSRRPAACSTTPTSTRSRASATSLRFARRNVKAHVDVLKDNDVVLNLFDDVQLTVHKIKVETVPEGQLRVARPLGRRRHRDAGARARRDDRHGDGPRTRVRNRARRERHLRRQRARLGLVPDRRSRWASTWSPTSRRTWPGTSQAAGPVRAATGADTSGPVIDAMVLWTPAARNAVGGTTDAIQSLVLAAVANANLAYANSGVHAQLRLVYSGEVNYTEVGHLDTTSRRCRPAATARSTRRSRCARSTAQTS